MLHTDRQTCFSIEVWVQKPLSPSPNTHTHTHRDSLSMVEQISKYIENKGTST